MIIERMEYELMDKFGEFLINEKEENKKENTQLQLAFEYLAFRYALTRTEKGKLDSEKEKSYWETISNTFKLSSKDTRLLFEIVYQCPKEFRIAHLSKASQSTYQEHLNVLKDGGFIYENNDFYGEHYQVSAALMRTIAFGEKWKETKKSLRFSSGLGMFDDFDDL